MGRTTLQCSKEKMKYKIDKPFLGLDSTLVPKLMRISELSKF